MRGHPVVPDGESVRLAEANGFENLLNDVVLALALPVDVKAGGDQAHLDGDVAGTQRRVLAQAVADREVIA